MKNSDVFDRMVEHYGNVYAAVNALAQSARVLAARHNNIILHSEAISWIITGETPEILLHRTSIRKTFVSAYDYLNYIEDSEIKDAVLASCKQSIKNHHLIYCYNDISDENAMARVRVITRLIWYTYKQEGDSNGYTCP